MITKSGNHVAPSRRVRPGDPLATVPLIRVATQLREPAPIAALALAQLRASEAASDPAAKAEAESRREDRRERAEARAALAPLRRQARAAEERLTKLTEEQAELEHLLADPALYEPGRVAEIAAANARLAKLARLVEKAEAEWLAAEEALEAAT